MKVVMLRRWHIHIMNVTAAYNFNIQQLRYSATVIAMEELEAWVWHERLQTEREQHCIQGSGSSD